MESVIYKEREYPVKNGKLRITGENLADIDEIQSLESIEDLEELILRENIFL